MHARSAPRRPPFVAFIVEIDPARFIVFGPRSTPPISSALRGHQGEPPCSVIFSTSSLPLLLMQLACSSSSATVRREASTPPGPCEPPPPRTSSARLVFGSSSPFAPPRLLDRATLGRLCSKPARCQAGPELRIRPTTGPNYS
jgi:hypothetical protein